jgi:outer membrane protein, multidrug efflux system
MKVARTGAFALLASTLIGCASTPAVHARLQPVPPQWTAAAAHVVSPGVAPDTDAWWKSFHDPELDSLVERAVAANYDLKLAAARVDEARAAHGGAASDYLPQITATASATRNRQFVIAPIPNAGGGVTPQPAAFEISNYRVGFDAAWELDVFGRIRHEVAAAASDVVASEQDRRSVLVSLLGEVGRVYADLRGLQTRVAIAEQNIAVAQDTVSLTQSLAQAGQATERDVAQAQTQLESVRAQVPTLKSGIQAAMHRLGVLTGQYPGALDAELAAHGRALPTPPDVPIGLPSDLLERRPDILRAEAQVVAATARIGQARADYFPRFTLLGTAGRQASQLHDLTLGLGNFFSIGPAISLPIFSRGRIRANVAVQTARAQQAIDVLQTTVLTSFEETENALAAYANEQDRRDRLEAAETASQTAVELATVQYRAGLTDFLTVLQADRDLYATQDLLAASRTAVTTDLVALYKALGGGWSVAE